jgi:hypothetical protein
LPHVVPALKTHEPPASAQAVKASVGEKHVVVHLPLRQHGPNDTGHGQAPPHRAPDPSGVLETASAYCAPASMLIADPPHRQLTVQ